MGTALFNIPGPERVLGATVLTPAGEIEVHNTHVPPGSSNGWVKIAHLTGLYECLAKETPGLRILCGDFNTPQAELETGEVITWAQRPCRTGGWRVARAVCGGVGTDWDTGERRVLIGLAFPFPDSHVAQCSTATCSGRFARLERPSQS